jgi:transcriptional regulator with XRE-family HTH domain
MADQRTPTIQRAGPTAYLDRHELRRRRREAGLNQVELAALAMIGRVHLSRLENGRRNPTPRTLRRLAAALPDCTVADLLHREDRDKAA